MTALWQAHGARPSALHDASCTPWRAVMRPQGARHQRRSLGACARLASCFTSERRSGRAGRRRNPAGGAGKKAGFCLRPAQPAIWPVRTYSPTTCLTALVWQALMAYTPTTKPDIMRCMQTQGVVKAARPAVGLPCLASCRVHGPGCRHSRFSDFLRIKTTADALPVRAVWRRYGLPGLGPSRRRQANARAVPIAGLPCAQGTCPSRHLLPGLHVT